MRLIRFLLSFLFGLVCAGLYWLATGISWLADKLSDFALYLQLDPDPDVD